MDFRRLCVNVSAMYNFLKGRLVVVRLSLLVTTLILVAIGIVTIYSVGHPADSGPNSQIERKLGGYWESQLEFAALGIVGFIGIIKYKKFKRAIKSKRTRKKGK